jgi:hypothetical protein
MEFLKLYIEMLRDPAVPGNRVVRKTAIIAIGATGFLWYYRHVVLGFAFGEPLLVTLGLSFLVMVIVGIFGGPMAGHFYETFLRSVGANKKELTITVFFAEWLFAAIAPLLGGLLFIHLSQYGE